MKTIRPNPLFSQLSEDLWEREGPVAVEWIPAVDIVETDREVTIKAEVPGMEANELNLILQDNTLMLRGERRTEKCTSGENFHRLERACGAFSRSFEIPATVDGNRVSAELKSGLLTIILPKLQSARKRTIAVHPAPGEFSATTKMKTVKE